MSRNSELSDREIKNKADLIRSKIAACSDREIAYFSDSVYEKSFESVSEHVKRLANEYDPAIPF